MSDEIISRTDILSGRAMTGTFYRAGGTNYFFSFLRLHASQPHLPNPSPNPLPSPSLSVCCSSAGLILCRSLPEPNSFFIINPTVGEFTGLFIPLPIPAIPIPPSSPLALVRYDNVLGNSFYEVVCALKHPNRFGVYYLYIYSSLRREWVDTNTTRRHGYIIPNSGISCGPMAYFRTEYDVVEIDMRSHNVQQFGMPEICSAPGSYVQLGSINCRLHLLIATDADVLIYSRSPLSASWERFRFVVASVVADGLFPSDGVIRPMRFESERFEFPLLVNGRPVILERADLIAGDQVMRVWALPMEGPAPERAEDCVPLIARPYVTFLA